MLDCENLSAEKNEKISWEIGPSSSESPEEATEP